MNKSPSVESARFRLDREQLLALAAQKRDAYGSARPFPHIVIDGMLPAHVLEEVLAEFPAPGHANWRVFDNPLERKLGTTGDSEFGEATRHLLAELNSAAFIDFLECLTGIVGLVPDPHFVGGGLHQIQRGGHLKVHADFNRHPQTGLERRLNLLLYLNQDWKEEYGGELELWDRPMRNCEAKILPVFNRCVIFTLGDTSFHGHPEPLTCPDAETRKSIACYYYSAPDRLRRARGEHSTLFQARPGEALPSNRGRMGLLSAEGARFLKRIAGRANTRRR
jgi:hypothetical protein